jgi:hypothetical protein
MGSHRALFTPSSPGFDPVICPRLHRERGEREMTKGVSALFTDKPT